MEYKNKRRLILGFYALLFVLLYIIKNYSFLIRASGVIFGLAVFYFIDHAFLLKFKFRHYLYILAILILGILLSPFYWMFENYDKALHLIMPILGSAIIFFIVNKMKIKFQWKLIITLAVIISCLTLLEIGEYTFDAFLDFKLQGVYIRNISGLEKYNLVMDRNDDTMMDLILGTLGSISFLLMKISAFIYKKFKK